MSGGSVEGGGREGSVIRQIMCVALSFYAPGLRGAGSERKGDCQVGAGSERKGDCQVGAGSENKGNYQVGALGSEEASRRRV